MENHGLSPSIYFAEGPGHASRLATTAVGAAVDDIVCVGGDGTLNEVVNGMAHSSVALGVLPTGTANVWAQEIGLPVPRLLSSDPNPLLTCIKQLADGETRTMDLGKINGRYFMMYGSVGFDAHVVHEMEQQSDLKARLGGIACPVDMATARRHRGLEGLKQRVEVRYRVLADRAARFAHRLVAGKAGDGALPATGVDVVMVRLKGPPGQPQGGGEGVRPTLDELLRVLLAAHDGTRRLSVE